MYFKDFGQSQGGKMPKGRLLEDLKQVLLHRLLFLSGWCICFVNFLRPFGAKLIETERI